MLSNFEALKQISSKSSRSEIFSSLTSKIPELESVLKSSQLAQNHEYVADEGDIEISPSDELAVIPPIGGG